MSRRLIDRSGLVVMAARAAIAMVVIVGSASETAGQSGNPSAFSKETFTYKTVGSTAIKADVYRLAGQDLRPCIVWIHGGALIFGSRAMLPADERERFLRAGYVVVAIDYRLAPETKLPQILEDIEDAHRWVRDRGAALFRIDPRRVADVGQSAGAYLALMAGVRVRPSLRAVVSFYGYGDIAGKWYSRPDAFYLRRPRVTKEHADGVVGRQVLSESAPVPRSDFYDYCRQNGLWPQEVAGLDPDAGPAKFKPYTPERLVTPAYPPTLLLHGDRDTDVPFGMSQRMAAVFKRQRVEHRLYRMKGFNHLFDVFPDGLPPEGRPTGLGNPQVSRAFDVVMDFLARHVAP